MVQHLLLKTEEQAILVADNSTSAFTKFLSEYLTEDREINQFSINAVMNNFDKLERDGVIFRSTLLDWLLKMRGKFVKCVIE